MELAFLSPVSYNNHLPGAGELHTRKALYHSDCRRTDPGRAFEKLCPLLRTGSFSHHNQLQRGGRKGLPSGIESKNQGCSRSDGLKTPKAARRVLPGYGSVQSVQRIFRPGNGAALFLHKLKKFLHAFRNIALFLKIKKDIPSGKFHIQLVVDDIRVRPRAPDERIAHKGSPHPGACHVIGRELLV